MLAKDIESNLDTAEVELNKAMFRKNNLAAEALSLNNKAAKLKTMHRQGMQQLLALKKSEVVLLSEFDILQRLTETAIVELATVQEQLSLNFLLAANNLNEINIINKAISALRELLQKTNNNILEFKK